MKRTLGMVLLLGVSASAQAGDLIWDNYLSPAPGHDSVNALSTERETVVPESWLVDDVVFDDIAEISEIRWIGLRDDDPGANYVGADVLIMDTDFQIVAEFVSLDFQTSVLGQQFGLEVYEGSVQLPGDVIPASSEAVILEPGNYYIGTRLVGNGLGRNFAATTGNGAMNGNSFGVWQSISFFGHTDWVNSADIDQFGGSDFAFQLYGTIVPEPASLALIAAGGLLLIRRR